MSACCQGGCEDALQQALWEQQCWGRGSGRLHSLMVRRETGSFGRLRRLRVIVDDAVIGRLWPGQSLIWRSQNGKHQIRVVSGRVSSQTVTVDMESGNALLVVRPGMPPSGIDYDKSSFYLLLPEDGNAESPGKETAPVNARKLTRLMVLLAALLCVMTAAFGRLGQPFTLAALGAAFAFVVLAAATRDHG